jgi:bile acid:Na+ symporter, BASS family
MPISSMLSVAAPIILALMMLGMGLSLKVSDFKRLLLQPKAILIGSSLQLIALPILGYLIVRVLGLEKELAVGFMILVACPGGPGSNLLTYICRGDAALSVSLTGISSMLAVITVPLVVNFAIIEFMQGAEENLSVVKTVVAVLLITMVPLSLGMVISRLFPSISARMKNTVKYSSIAFLLLLVVSTFYKERSHLPELLSQVGLPTLLLCLLTLTMGFLVSKLFKLSNAIQKTIAIEVGLQNAALAMVVAGSLLNSNAMAVPAAMYSPVMISASLLFMLHAFVTRGEALNTDTAANMGT